MNPKAATLFRVFLPFAAGYFLSFLYRTVNAVLAPALLRDLGLSSSSLGLLTVTYFIAFASFQLPLGVLLDRFGPRRIEALLLLVAALGAFCFSRADSLVQLILGRALIGLALFTLLVAVLVLWIVPEKRVSGEGERLSDQLRGIGAVFTNPKFCRHCHPHRIGGGRLRRRGGDGGDISQADLADR